jgi:hypothetical protein
MVSHNPSRSISTPVALAGESRNANQADGDLFGFYLDMQSSAAFVIDVVGPFYNGAQVATSEVLLDGDGVSVNGWTGSNTTRLISPGLLPAGNYFVYIETQSSLSFIGGPYSLTFNHYVDPIVSPVTSDPVPAPASLPLFATGLGLLALLRWRRRNSEHRGAH